MLESELEKAGHEVWLDRSAIQGGAFWQEEIVKAVGKAEVVLLVVSSRSAESPHVERELGLAALKRKRIVPLILDNVDVPDKMDYALGAVERISLGSDFQVGIRRLIHLLATQVHENARPNTLAAEERAAPAPRRRWREFWFVSLLIALCLAVEYVMESLFGLGEGSSVPVLVLAGLIWMVSNALRARLAIRRLRSRGKVLFTQYKGIRVDRSNGSERMQIVSQWEDDENHESRLFYSDALPSDPSELMELVKIIRVFVDSANPKRYYMDLSFLRGGGGVPLLCGRGGVAMISQSGHGESLQFHCPSNAQAPGRPLGKQFTSAVFLSRSEQDAKKVASLTHALEEAGYTIFPDRSYPGGTSESDEAVVSKIEKASVFLLALSPFSVESERVERELLLAVARGKKIIPIVLHPVQLPANLEYALVGFPRIDLSIDFEQGVSRLLGALSSDETHPLLGQKRRISAEWTGGLLGIVCSALGGSLVVLLWNGGAPFTQEYLVVFLALALGSATGGIFGVWSADLMEMEDVLNAGLVALGFAVGLNCLWFELGLRHAWLGPTMGAAGAAAWTMMRAITTSRSIRNLKTRGIPLLTDYKCVRVKASGFNFRDRWQLVSQWRDPRNRDLYLFYSKEISFDLKGFVPTKTITVFVEPGNMQKYYMDLSFLPRTTRGLFNL
jgi:hypothetical protein